MCLSGRVLRVAMVSAATLTAAICVPAAETIDASMIPEVELDWSVETPKDAPRSNEPEDGMRRRTVHLSTRAAPTESAVMAGLTWLTEHQLPDGGWCFAHNTAPSCQGSCPDPGRADRARTAATSLVLLPFLGAGHTHRAGRHRTVVGRGLEYLAARVEADKDAFPADDSSAVTCAWSALVFCSAFCMTGDTTLRPPAQQTLDRLAARRNTSGGWSSAPGGPSDTTATAWALIALKSGRLACLEIDPRTPAAAKRFLDTIQLSGRGSIGAAAADEASRVTAASLLCRLHGGDKPEEPVTKQAISGFDRLGPSRVDPVHNFFVSQIARYDPSDALASWNRRLRPLMIESQTGAGHATGSWCPTNQELASQHGGRLQETAMNLLSLEVYYLHLPVWRPRALTDTFAHPAP